MPLGEKPAPALGPCDGGGVDTASGSSVDHVVQVWPMRILHSLSQHLVRSEQAGLIRMRQRTRTIAVRKGRALPTVDEELRTCSRWRPPENEDSTKDSRAEGWNEMLPFRHSLTP